MGDADAPWHSLAEFSGPTAKLSISSVNVRIESSTPERLSFITDYALTGPGQEGRHVLERYVLSANGVECKTTVTGGNTAMEYRAEFPVLISDGASDLPVKKSAQAITVDDHGSRTSFALQPSNVSGDLQLIGPRLVNHNGYLQRAVAPLKGPALTYTVTLDAPK